MLENLKPRIVLSLEALLLHKWLMILHDFFGWASAVVRREQVESQSSASLDGSPNAFEEAHDDST